MTAKSQWLKEDGTVDWSRGWIMPSALTIAFLATGDRKYINVEWRKRYQQRLGLPVGPPPSEYFRRTNGRGS